VSRPLVALLAGPASPPLEVLARAFADDCQADGAIIFLSDGGMLGVGAACPADPADPAVEGVLRLSVGFGVTGLVARNGRAVRLSSDSPRNAAHRQLLGLAAGERVARMCLPARGVAGQVLGVLTVHRGTERPFTDDDLARVQPLADLLGLRLHAQRLMQAADEHRTERDRLIAQAISAQEAERRRIAFDLHDGVTTALASLSFHLNAADLSLGELSECGLAPGEQAAGGPAPGGDPREDGRVRAMRQAQAQIGSARSLADLAYTQTRAAITGLHSLVLDDLGIVAALESLVQTAPQVDVEFVADPTESFAELPAHAASALFRIAQETTSNAVRHAQATRVVLSLRRVGDVVVLGTIDDGVGFDARESTGASTPGGDGGTDAEHFGLSSIAERCALLGASLRVESVPGRGTTVIVEIPVPGSRRGAAQPR